MNLKKVKTVIVGGGVQAVALALRCLKEGHKDFVIVDPQPLLNEWVRNVLAQGIDKLRTPFTAHLDPSDDPEAMMINLQNGRPLKGVNPAEPAHSYLFNGHSLRLVRKAGLEKYRVPGQVKLVEHRNYDSLGNWMVTVSVRGEEHYYLTDDVVCAVGLGKPWMPDLCIAHPNIVHSHYVNANDLPYGRNFCVVGSGLTAATLAVKMAESGAKVDLCGRSQMSVQQLETDPLWRPGERLQKAFVNVEDHHERARQLKAARTANVVTPDIWERVVHHAEYGSIEMHTGVSVDGVEITEKNAVRLNSKDHDAVIFATGYKVDVRNLPMFKHVSPILMHVDGLPVLENNFESNLQGLFFMGKLGELAGGPLMRNIPGARYASKQIVAEIA